MQAVDDAVLLGDPLQFRLVSLLVVLGPAEAQLSAGDDHLLQRRALPLAQGRPARLASRAHLLGVVAEDRVGAQAGLERPRLGGPHLGGRLGQGRVALQGDLLQVGQRQAGGDRGHLLLGLGI